MTVIFRANWLFVVSFQDNMFVAQHALRQYYRKSRQQPSICVGNLFEFLEKKSTVPAPRWFHIFLPPSAVEGGYEQAGET